MRNALQRNSKIQNAGRDPLVGEKREQSGFELTLKQHAEMRRVGGAGTWPLKQEDIRLNKSVSGRVHSIAVK